LTPACPYKNPSTCATQLPSCPKEVDVEIFKFPLNSIVISFSKRILKVPCQSPGSDIVTTLGSFSVLKFQSTIASPFAALVGVIVISSNTASTAGADVENRSALSDNALSVGNL